MAYLAGNRQLARQIERQAGDHDFPVVRFQDSKDAWSQKDVRTCNFARAVGPLRDYFTVFARVRSAPGGRSAAA